MTRDIQVFNKLANAEHRYRFSNLVCCIFPNQNNLLTGEGSMKTSIKRFGFTAAVASALSLQACGGGGDSPAAAPAPATGLFDDTVALKLALVMLGEGPVGPNESRDRGDYRAAWSSASSTTTTPCPGRLGSQTYTDTLTNLDSTASAGDRVDFVSLCNYRHSSTNGLWLTQQLKEDYTLTTVTDPLFSGSRDWTLIDSGNQSRQYRYEAILVGGALTYSTSLLTKTRTSEYKVVHSANDSETQTATRNATLIDESLGGNSNVKLSTRYTCKYGIGLRTDPDCSDTQSSATGTIMGITISANLVGIAAPKWAYDVTDGANKIAIRLKAFGNGYNLHKFTITLPSGKVVEVSGEDIQWVSGG
jgi:hypothetical protein